MGYKMATLQAAPPPQKSHKRTRKPNSDYPQMLPQTGHIRVNQVAVFVPFSTSTIWRKVRAGKFPKPYILSERITAWKVEEVRAWIEAQKRA